MCRTLPGILALALALVTLLPSPADATKRRAFVTSVSGSGNLASWPDAGGQGGLTAADNICRARAIAGSLPNAPAYRAWLSTAATDAYCHVQGLTGKRSTGCSGSTQAAGPWYRVNGSTPFTGSLSELTGPDYRIFQPISFDEFGNEPPASPLYWTGTDEAGVVMAETCSSWVVGTSGAEGVAGSSRNTAVDWSFYAWADCDEQRHLLCLEPGPSEPAATVAWQPAALVFVTSTYGSGDLSTWPAAQGENGLEAGDAICRNLAAAAHLPVPESFFAWLSDSTDDARDRMALDGVPYRRVNDHFRVALSRAELLASFNSHSIHVDEHGEYIGNRTGVWTGSTDSGSWGGNGTHCANWSSNSTGDEGLAGKASRLKEGSWTESGSSACSVGLRLYCFSNVETLFWDGFDISEDAGRWSSIVP
jgi:hypothetical protein